MIDRESLKSIHTIISYIARALMARYHDHALCTDYAWWMLEAITHQSRAQLLASCTLTPAQAETLNTWIMRQIDEHIPLAYLIGSVPFASIDVSIEPPLLIPRQETEEWTIKLIEQLKKNPCHDFSLLDLCTGSGCIALAIAHAFPHATIYALDISERALHVTRTNMVRNNITNVQLIHSDLFQAVPSLKVDIIVSNPPYIAPEELPTLESSVKDWEDHAALIAPDHGLGILKKIIKNARAHLRQDRPTALHAIPQLWLEIGHTQGTTIKDLMQNEGFFSVTIHKDIHDKDRVVTGCIPYDATI